MKNFILQGRLSDYEYDIYKNPTDKQPMNLQNMSPNRAKIIRCIAFINYVKDHNNKMSPYYRKTEKEVENAILNIFNNQNEIEKDSLLKYFGINPNGEVEWSAINNLTRDMLKDDNCAKNINKAVTAMNFTSDEMLFDLLP